MEFSVSNVVSTTLSMIRQRLGGLVGIWAIYFAAQIGLVIFLSLALGFSAMAANSFENPGAMGAGTIVGLVVFYAFYLLVYGAQSASLSLKASPLLDFGIGDALSRGIKAAPSIVGAMIILLIAYFLGALVAGLLGAVLAFMGAIGTLIFAAAAVVAMVYLGCRLSVVVPVIVIDGELNPIKAIIRGWNLSKGKVLGILGSFLIYILIMVGVGLTIFLPFYFMVSDPADLSSAAWALILLIPLGLIFIVLFTILSAALISAIHAVLSGNGADVSEVFG